MNGDACAIGDISPNAPPPRATVRMTATYSRSGTGYVLNNFMKMRFILLLVLIFALVLRVDADTLPNAVTVSLTPYLTFFLQSEWGGGIPTNQFQSDEMICRTVAVNSTNIVCYRSLPLWSQFYGFKLYDDQGREVVKTEKGTANSMAPALPSSVFELHRKFKPQAIKGHDVRELFRPSEMFVITNKGTYKLAVQMRRCVPATNGLPDTNVMMSFRKMASVEDVIIVESPPVLVNVIK